MLRVEAGPVEYLGYDDGGTPEDESDDNHLCYLRWYALYSGRDSSYGEIWLYDPDLDRVKIWLVPVLECVVHEGCDGLTANLNGETHGVIVHVPVKLMSKEGTYRFVLHFYDDYADSYKDHQVKAALEVNQRTPEPALHVWVGRNILNKIYSEVPRPEEVIKEVSDAFERIGVTIIWHWGPDNLGNSFEGISEYHLPKEVIEKEAKGLKGVHVLLEDWPRLQDYGETHHPRLLSINKYSPQNPAKTRVDFDQIKEGGNLKWGLVNTLIHEFTHAASRGKVSHCDDKTLTCVMYPSGRYPDSQPSHIHQKLDHGTAIYTVESRILWLKRQWIYKIPLGPWHSVNEIFAIRKGIGLDKLYKGWTYWQQ